MRINTRILVLFSLVATAFLGVLGFDGSAYSIAKQSTLSISVQSSALSLNLIPSPGGTFGESGNASVSVSTDNFTGYNLSIVSRDDSSLVNLNNDEIESISSSVTRQDFSTNSAYNNKWGLNPSQYVTSSGGVDTPVSNSDFLPAPLGQGLVLAKTSTANSLDGNNDPLPDTYTFNFGARVDTNLPAGSYTGTYVLTAVANMITYSIVYDSNTVETVAGMPSPNPQSLQINGGTPTADSHAALSNATPVMTSGTIKTFGGWCDGTTSVDSTTGNQLCSGTTYQPGDDYPIDQTVDGSNITLYALWLVDPFPVVWSQTGKCIFADTLVGSDHHGSISGSECSKYVNDEYIDTEIALYSDDNYQKDYEVHFTIDTYSPGSQAESQATIFSDKLSTSTGGGNPRTAPYYGRAPGIIVRKSSSNGLEIKSTYGGNANTAGNEETRPIIKSPPATAFNGTDIRIFRIDGVIYTSVDNGPLVELQDVSSFNQQFGLTAWFGAYPDNVDCSVDCTAAKRFFTGELSNMYIKLGDLPASRLHTITFDGNQGTPATTTYLLLDGDALGELPTVTRSGWLFDGWWTASSGGQQISTATVPTATITYYAHWYKSVADAQITNTSVSMSINDTETINITNAADIEPYTLVSSDTSVATVSSAGVITAVGNGAATITLTGSKTGDTRTISVAVGTLISVYFDSQGGTPSTYTEPVADGGSFSSLPTPTKAGYTLEGWYTGTNGTGDQLTTSTVFDANTPTQYYANWTQSNYVCKAAIVRHEEPCSRSSAGCRAAGYALNATISYGSLIQPGATALAAGNALTCDIDNNGIFDESNERFYYYTTVGNNAALIYYKNISNDENPWSDGLALLPTSSTTGWTNPNLVEFTSGDYAGKVARYISYSETVAACNNSTEGFGTNGKCLYILEQSNFAYTNIRDGYWVGSNDFSRVHTSSRKLTSGSQKNGVRPVIEVPLDLIDISVRPSSYTIIFDPQNGDNSFTETVAAGSALGNKYPSPDPTYTNHIFKGWYTAASGGTLVTDQTVPDGDWTYHAQWKGTVALAQVASNAVSVIEGNTAMISVTNAADLENFVFSSSDTSVATIDSSTGVVTAVSEGTTTISIIGDDSHATNSIVTVTVVDGSSSFRVTFDPRNGDSTFYIDVMAGDTIGAQMPSDPTYVNHVFMRWYNVSNDNTVTSATHPGAAMTVYAEWKLDVAQAIISNADLTLAAGDQLTILVDNSAQLEPYTFSSANTAIATVDASTGVITGVAAGTVNIIMTGTQSGLTKTMEVHVTAAPVIRRTVTFNANGGTTPTPSAIYQVDDGDQVGSLPTTTRANYRFFGWYKDDGTFYDEVYQDEVINADVTFYARWVEDTTSFPIVFSEINECQFNGNAVISGTYCTQNKTKKYIDSGIALFSTANYQKDFEIGFTVVELTSPQLVNQGTLVNAKYEYSSWNYPGFVYRSVSTGPNFELTGRFSNGDPTAFTAAGTSLKRIRIVRENGVLKYSVNGGALTTWFDASGNTYRFNTNVWFGASVQGDNTTPQRYLSGKLTDMYVKLGVQTDYLINFDPGNGSFTNSSDSSRTITINDPLGTLPVPNPPSSSYTFVGWFDESTSPATQVTDLTVPDSNKTYIAHYSYQSSDTPVSFDVSNNATRGYQNLIDSWVQSPVNITTFNEASPINNSTWGDTSELSELEFWEDIRSNFIDNQCMIPSYSDATKPLAALSAWTNGSVDCSKPDAYDTDIGAALTVRLNNAQGAVVSYAKADNGVIHNMIPGQTYYWEKSDDSTVYGYVTATSNKGTRWVNTGTIRNVRDLGGLPVTYTDSNNQTVTGTLAYGRLFRGEKLNSAPATELTNLGITTEYNVGDEYSGDTHLSDYHLNQVIHYNFDYNSGDENNPNSNYMKAWTAVTNIMTDISNTNTTKNVYFHCRVGADRTGTVAYLLEGLLGVPDEMRYEEYALTNVSGLYDRTRYYKEKSSTNNLKFVYMMGFVKTTQDIYNWYMHNPNASVSLIQSFRSAMTVTGNNNQNNQNSQSNQASSNSIQNGGLALNNTSSQNSDTHAGSFEDENLQPLGVTESTESASPASILIAAAAVVASGAAVSYALAKRNEEESS